MNKVYRTGDYTAPEKGQRYPRYLVQHIAPNRRERKYIMKQLARGVAPGQIRIPHGL